MTKVVINRCFGGFGLSDAAYEWLIAHGIPAKKYITPERDPATGLYNRESFEECIYDRSLTPKGENQYNDYYWKAVESNRPASPFGGRYWDSWSRADESRSHPLIVQCVEELGSKVASAALAELEVVEIPDGVKWIVEEYDGSERVAERHRTW